MTCVCVLCWSGALSALPVRTLIVFMNIRRIRAVEIPLQTPRTKPRTATETYSLIFSLIISPQETFSRLNFFFELF